MSDPSFEHRVFRIAPELRRSLYYAIAGAIALSSVAWWVESTVKIHEGVHVVSVVFALVGVLAIYPLSWRLEVDGDGLVRHRLGVRDHWRWDDFASGRVEKHYQFVLLDPGRPWWCRNLVLDYLRDTDRQQVLALLNPRYRLPTAPPLPESLTIKFRLRTATFARHEIQVVERCHPTDYRWADVRHLHIARMDAVRRDFAELDLVLPDREIGLGQWRGASAEETNDFLLSHVSSARISVDVVGERPHCLLDVERAINRTRRELRQSTVYLCGCVIYALGCGVWLLTQFAPILALTIMLPFSIVAWIPTILRRKVTNKHEQLVEWRAELETELRLATRR